MIAVDTNVLVYAHRQEASEHSIASRSMKEFCEGSVSWAIPWPCIYEFFSVVTNTRIWKDKASTQKQAVAQLEVWMNSPRLILLREPDGFFELLHGLINRPRVKGGKVHDARIAALCLAHGADALMSRDRDFSLFPELRVLDPFN